MGEERDEVMTEEEVKEEASEETNEEGEEQREDDYQGLARRIDDLAEVVQKTLDAVQRVENGMGIFVESGATITEAPEEVEDFAEDILEEILDIEDLDLEL